jgi:hypothetical protein
MTPRYLLTLATLIVTFTSSHAQTWLEHSKFVASDRAEDDRFGLAIDITDELAIIGAFWEDEDANGMNTMDKAGSVYIFGEPSAGWKQQQKLVASDRAAGDYFGYAVAISGQYAFVGAMWEDEDANGLNTVENAGSVYVFENQNGTWNQVQKIVASDRMENDYFGRSIAVSGDFMVIGAYGVDVDEQGANPLNGAGAVYVFRRTNNSWVEMQKVVASDRSKTDRFGEVVEIDEDYFIVGAPSKDVLGTTTKYDVGAAYIFQRQMNSWVEVNKLMASDADADDEFGRSVEIYQGYVAVGAPEEDENSQGEDTKNASGSIYIFEENNGNWTETQKVVASDRSADDNFGISVALNKDQLFVGAHQDKEDANGENPMTRAGSMYVFSKVNGNWKEEQKLCARDREQNAQFGCSIAASENVVLVGAWRASTDENGSNPLDSPGAAYLFDWRTLGAVRSSYMPSVLISPNPFVNELRVELAHPSKNVKLQLISVDGSLLIEKSIDQRLQLDLSALPRGLYFLHVTDGHGMDHWHKLVK